MVFYFSGTGNSYQAALAVKSGQEEPLNMADCLRGGELSFALAPGEALVFVFPVYFGGVPSLVREFVSRASFSGGVTYCCGVFTCGAKSYGTGNMLARDLAQRGIKLDAAFTVVMPDNYAIMYKIDDEATRGRKLSAAEKELADIKSRIEAREKSFGGCGLAAGAMTKLMYPFYAHGRSTRKFYADDKCVGCGVCASRCPVGAIEMTDGRPKWVKDRCVRCMACMRCNAVQFGRHTAGRERYTNPVLKKHSHDHA